MTGSVPESPTKNEPWEPCDVTSFEHFVASVGSLTPAALSSDEFWFRGQSNETWPLETSLMRTFSRLELTEDELIELESVAMKAFRWTAHLHVRPELLEKVKTIPCWWSLMQHHRAPTRLLDWSVSPFVAAYFAVLQEGHDEPGVVWAFCSSHLSEAFRRANDGEAIPSFEQENVADWYKKKLERLKGKGSVIPLSFSFASSERIVAQQGRFTMSFDIRGSHGALADQIAPRYTRKFVIPAALKPEFLLRLRAMNITGASLFPGVDGLGMAMKELVSLGKYYQKAVCPIVLTGGR